ncbi:MAG: thioredoxin family protein [Bacteroidota bacterium]
MNKKLIFFVVIAGFVGVFFYTALTKTAPIVIENAPEWRTVPAALDEAVRTEKYILVDVYEVGCKYCRAMEREVYPDSTVRQVLDAGFIPAKIDGNSQELITINGTSQTAQEFAQAKGAFAFPTTMIMDSEGNVIKKRTGYMGVDELRQFMYLETSNL